MKLFRFALFLVVLVYFVSIAAADITSFYISSGTHDSTNTSAYVYGGSMGVTATSTEAKKMMFKWYSPAGNLMQTTNDQDVPFTATYSNLNLVGNWMVQVTDIDDTAETAYLYFWIQHPTITYTYSVIGTTGTGGGLLINNAVTATVTPSSTLNDGVSMIFEWYSPSSSTTPVRTYTVSKSSGSYTDTLPASLFTTTGSWTIKVYEYSSSSCTQSTLIGSDNTGFTGEGTPEFPLGSFVPLLLAGAVYIKVRRNTEGS